MNTTQTKSRPWIGGRASLALVVLGISACGRGGITTGPTVVGPIVAPTQTQLVTARLSGRVFDDEAGPVLGGVKVTVYGLTSGRSTVTSTTTGPDGVFNFDFQTLPASRSVGVELTKADYATTENLAAGDGLVFRKDFRIFRSISVTVGQPARVFISPDNSLCGLDGEFQCRVFSVITSAAGTLIVDSSSADSQGGCGFVRGGADALATFPQASPWGHDSLLVAPGQVSSFVLAEPSGSPAHACTILTSITR